MRCAVKCQSPSDERSAGDPHATFCGSRERVTAPGHPVRGQQCPRLLGHIAGMISREFPAASGQEGGLRDAEQIEELAL